jgi:glutamyl-tRNA synthetase
MHVGNARIAIVNYLFARQMGGRFIFRIDDTDSERSTKEYEDAIISDLAWLQISYNETFRQSERTTRYGDIRNDLASRGILYKCYESQEELEYKRRMALAGGRPPVYDREALTLTDDQIRKFAADGVKPYWRFKLPNKTISWDDIVLGHVSYDLANVSDPVVVKADGTYLYSFSSVVDDVDTGITHIIRGQDHVTNTAVQIAMFDAVSNGQYDVKFAHLSLLVNKDGSQFSKRLGGMSIGDFRSSGIDPMAIACLLATLGTSINVKPFQTMDELVEYFDIAAFGTNSPKFDAEDVVKLNKKILQLKRYEDVKQYVSSREIFEATKNNIETYNDFAVWNEVLARGYDPDYEPTESEAAVLKVALKHIHVACSARFLEDVQSESGVSGKALYMPLRKALTGFEHGPNMSDLLSVLGIEEIERRLTLFVK